MKKLNRKGAIELSANFIVVIVISIVILVGGLSLFFKMVGSAKHTVDGLDQQTQAKIKDMMLTDNYRTAVYPSDVVLSNDDSASIGVGITNFYDVSVPFNVRLSSVTYYATASLPGIIKPNSDLPKYHSITSNGVITIGPRAQAVKEILLIMPKDSQKGQYVYTISITNGTTNPPTIYGVLQVYVTNK